MVTSAAYLLFYRRRSAVPLGGPRFQEIFERYNQGSPDDDVSESGEGQRLGQGSSQRGSPSASTGAGPAHPRGGRGWDRRGDFEQSSSYTDFDTDLPPWGNESGLHTSIEADAEDEGIGMPDYESNMAAMTSVIGPTWSFDNIGAGSKAGSDVADAIAEDDLASDVAQNDGSSVNGDAFDDAGAGPNMGGLLYREPGADYSEPPEPTPNIEFVDDYSDVVPPPPSAENQDYMSRIAAQSWVSRQIHTVPPVDGLDGAGDDDRASDKVAEIHVGDADGDAEEAKPHA